MKTVPVRASASIAIRQPRLVDYKITDRKSLIRRFQHFIESTDWEKRYLCHKSIDKICLGSTIAAMIYFIPVLMSMLWTM